MKNLKMILALGVVISFIGIAVQRASAQGTVMFEQRIGGVVNGEPLGGLVNFTVDPQTGNFEFQGQGVQLPRDFTPLPATGSAISFMCASMLALPLQGALNKVELTGGNFDEFRTLIVEDDQGEIIGDLILALSVRTRNDQIFAIFTGGGTYDGPLDGIFPGNANVVWFQLGKGLVTGRYTQTVFTSQFTPIFITGNTFILYRTERELPFPQVLRVRFNSYRFSIEEMTFGATGRAVVDRLAPFAPDLDQQEAFESLDEILPKVSDLLQSYPNPFNPSTVISYDLPKDTHVKLVIYNLLGEKIRTLVDGFETAGFKEITWDGTDDTGKRVASGVYLSRVEAGSFTMARKMTLIH